MTVMVTSMGIDIVETVRIKSAYERFGKRFLKHILGSEEKNIFDKHSHRMEFLAGCFAVKEAAIKALGAYLEERPPFHVIQVINDTNDRYHLVLPEEVLACLTGVRILVSVSHFQNNAVAMVIFEEEK